MAELRQKTGIKKFIVSAPPFGGASLSNFTIMNSENHQQTQTQWKGITITIRYCPKGTTLPITETGYRSHFIQNQSEIQECGGAKKYALAWFEKASKSAEWQKHLLKEQQLSLF